ncbi:MAG: nucleotide exchange factor GrpE [Bacilli bacterium]
MSEKEIMTEEVEKEEIHEETENVNDDMEVLKKEVHSLKDKVLRNAAELENFKRRTNEEKQNFMRYATGEIMTDLITVIDNFDRAIESCNSEINNNALDGFKLIYKQIVDITEKNGVELVASVGEEFDPNFHQAVMTGKDDNYESGAVIEEFQKGYKIKDKILRPAMVKVNE